MYQQIKINHTQIFLKNIIWRENPRQSLQCIKLTTITYGNKFAPIFVTRTSKVISLIHENSYPYGFHFLLTQFYVDDILYSCDNLDDLENSYRQLAEILNYSGNHLHKWCTNSQEFLQTFCESDIIFKSKIHQAKFLGLCLQPLEDLFFISLPHLFSDYLVSDSITRLIS